MPVYAPQVSVQNRKVRTELTLKKDKIGKIFAGPNCNVSMRLIKIGIMTPN